MTVHHQFDGPLEAPAVVLSNSLGTTLEMWDPQMATLTERFRVLRYDTCGHGRSDAPPSPYSVGGLGNDVLQLLDELGLERVSFCGLSLGGMTGMWLGAQAPERIDRLVLCCTSAHLGPPELWVERAETVRAQGAEVLADAIMQRWFSARFHETQAETVARFRAMVASTPAEGYAGCCDAIREWDFRERLGAITAPTLVIAGAEDPATPPEQAELIAGGIAGARLVVIPDAAHLANVEQTQAFDRALLDGLEAA